VFHGQAQRALQSPDRQRCQESFIMNRILQNLLALGACLALVFFSVQPLSARRVPDLRSAGGAYLYDLERAIYLFTNAVRQRYGLPALTWDNSLRDVARAHSADMLVRHYFSHVSPEGRSPQERVLAACRTPLSLTGENLWMGAGRQTADTKQLARIIVDSWMSSPGHRQNLLHPDFTDIGVGVASNGREVQVTQMFGRHRQ